MFFNNKYNESTIFDISINSFYKTERKMLEQVKDRNVLDLNKIPDPTELGKWYNQDPYAVVYLDNLKRGYEKKIEMLDAFQRGYSLNPRSNDFYVHAGYFDAESNFREVAKGK